MSGKLFGEAYRTFHICVDTYESGEMHGQLCHPGLETEGTAFRSLAQMLIRMEDMMEAVNYPQSFTARRTFCPISEQNGRSVALTTRTGKRATFLVRVLFRQHASWQGSVTWVEGRGEQRFRSVLELILLMDSALGGTQAEEQPA